MTDPFVMDAQLEFERGKAAILVKAARIGGVLIALVALLNWLAIRESSLSAFVNNCFAITFLALGLGRVTYLLRFDPQHAGEASLKRFKWSVIALSTMLGLCWGLWLFFGQEMKPNGQMMAASLVAGCVFLALSSLATYPAAYLGFCLPLIAALATIPVHDLEGKPSYTPVLSGSLLVFAIYMLIQYRKVVNEGLRATGRLRALELQYQRMFSSAHASAIWLTETGDLQISHQATQHLQLAPNARLETVQAGFGLKPGHYPRLLERARARVLRERMFSMAARFTRSDTTVLWLDLQVCAADPLEPSRGLIITLADATARRLAEQRNRWLARHDPLTGVFNRVTLEKRLHELCALAADHPSAKPFCVLALDLDGFKAINDLHGHAVGDEVLRIVAKRMQHTLRQSDLVARVGGDEFLVLLEDTSSPEKALLISQALHRSIGHEMSIDSRLITIGVSIGCAVWPSDATSAHGLLRMADAAMYEIKYAARDRRQQSLTGII